MHMLSVFPLSINIAAVLREAHPPPFVLSIMSRLKIQDANDAPQCIRPGAWLLKIRVSGNFDVDRAFWKHWPEVKFSYWSIRWLQS